MLDRAPSTAAVSSSALPPYLSVMGNIAAFVVPSLAYPLVVYGGTWSLTYVGMSPATALVVAYGVFFIALLGATWVFVAKENLGSSGVLRSRLWLGAPPRGGWISSVVLGTTLVTISHTQWFHSFLELIPYRRLFTRPASYEAAVQALNAALTPGPLVIAIVGLSLLLNVLSEEIWWRGYILPRQQRVWPRMAWLANGLGWAGFHWAVRSTTAEWILSAPYCVVIPLLASRYRSIWPGLVIHLLWNGFPFAALLLSRSH